MSLFVPPVNSNYFNITTCFMVTGKGSRMFKLSWSTACHTWMSCSVAAGLFWYTTSTEARLVRHLRPNKVYSWHLKNRKKRVKCLSTWCISSSLSGYWEPTGSLLGACWEPEFHWSFFIVLCDWSKQLIPRSQPVRCKTKTNTNRAFVSRLFLSLKSVIVFLNYELS